MRGSGKRREERVRGESGRVEHGEGKGYGK